MAQLSNSERIASPSAVTSWLSYQLLQARFGRPPRDEVSTKGTPGTIGFVSAFGKRCAFTNLPERPVSLQIPSVLFLDNDVRARSIKWKFANYHGSQSVVQWRRITKRVHVCPQQITLYALCMLAGEQKSYSKFCCRIVQGRYSSKHADSSVRTLLSVAC